MKMEQACRCLHHATLGQGFNSPHLHQKSEAAKRAAFIFGERSRKASFHAFGNLPHKRQSQKLFTSSRGDSRSSLKLRQRLACEDISFRLRSITLVKRSASLPVKFLPGGSMVGDVITARLRRLNFPYTLPNATFNADFLKYVWMQQ